jgi:large conductance mechanosensitive channel
MIKEFMSFLKHYGVIGLAIAVIIGGKLNALVTTIVGDLLTPLIFQPALKLAGVENIAALSFNGILYGKVVAAIIDFLIVAFLIFLFAKKVMKEDVVSKK